MEVPEDIDIIATNIVRADYSGEDKDSEYELYLTIARALLSERIAATERAARIAEEWTKEPDIWHIAAAIRA